MRDVLDLIYDLVISQEIFAITKKTVSKKKHFIKLIKFSVKKLEGKIRGRKYSVRIQTLEE